MRRVCLCLALYANPTSLSVLIIFITVSIHSTWQTQTPSVSLSHCVCMSICDSAVLIMISENTNMCEHVCVQLWACDFSMFAVVHVCVFVGACFVYILWKYSMFIGGWGCCHSYLLFMKAAAAMCSGVREIPSGVSLVTLPVWDQHQNTSMPSIQLLHC